MYDALLDKGIPSLIYLVKTFGKEWDLNLDEKLIEDMTTPPWKKHVKEETLEGEYNDKY